MSNEIIYDYGKNPVNYGKITDFTFDYLEKNISCGEELHFYLKLTDDLLIEKISFEGEGRMITIASASIISEFLDGKHLEEVKNINKQDVLDMLEVDVLSSKRMRSALLSLLTLRNALNTLKKNPIIDFEDLQ